MNVKHPTYIAALRAVAIVAAPHLWPHFTGYRPTPVATFSTLPEAAITIAHCPRPRRMKGQYQP